MSPGGISGSRSWKACLLTLFWISAYTVEEIKVVHYGQGWLKKNTDKLVINARMHRLRAFYLYGEVHDGLWYDRKDPKI